MSDPKLDLGKKGSAIKALAAFARSPYAYEYSEDDHNLVVQLVSDGRNEYDSMIARIRELETENERINDFAKEFIWNEDHPREAGLQCEQLAASEKRAEAWYRVHECSMEMSGIAICECEDLTVFEDCACVAEIEPLSAAYDAAIEHAHSIDNRRCPQCKGEGGYLGSNMGFVPCATCDGNSWEDILAEQEYQAGLDKEAGR